MSIPRRRGRPPNADTEALVLAAARAIEAEVGYDGATVDAIAARAGVAKTSIYRRWPNKGLLMYHAVIGASPTMTDVPDTGDLVADLLHVVAENAAGLVNQRFRLFLASLMAECQRDPELAALLRDELFGPRAAAITQRVAAGVARGEVTSTIDAELVPALLTGPLQYLIIVHGSELTMAELRRIVEAVVTPHLRGVNNRRASR